MWSKQPEATRHDWDELMCRQRTSRRSETIHWNEEETPPHMWGQTRIGRTGLVTTVVVFPLCVSGVFLSCCSVIGAVSRPVLIKGVRGRYCLLVHPDADMI